MLTRANFDLSTDGPPATYPSTFRGCHWGSCSRSRLPIRVADLELARSSWRPVLRRAGTYDVAYDLWTNTTSSVSGQPDGSEIMIWLRKRGPVRPAGTVTGRARISGTSWTVWQTRMDGWNYIAYQRTDRARSVRDLNVRAFVRDSIERGSTERAWYLTSVEAGFEIWRGGRGLGTDSFSLRLR